MALEDLTPFGTLPRAYQGLLSTEDTAALQKRAQIQGLLGAGLALAKGMSAYGPPRSALQNIIGAVAGGFEGAGGAYEGGLKQAMNAQDIRQKQIQIQQADLLRKEVENVMRTPEVANNPSLVALLRADPKKGLEWINENMAVTQAYAKTMPQQQPTIEGGEANVVTAPMDERARLFAENRILTAIGTKRADEKLQTNLKLIEAYDKQEEINRKLSDFTKEEIRVANYLFPDRDVTKPLTGEQNKKVTEELQRLAVEQKKAGATNLNVNLPTESERTAGYLTTRLKNSLSQYQDVVGGNQKAALPNLSAEVVKGITRSDYLKNLVTPEDRQRAEAAQLDIVSAALTLSTGAAYTKEELEAQTRTYFPQLGDKPGTIRDKAVRLDKLLRDAAMVKAGRAAPAPLPSGSSLMNIDTNAIIQELEKRKKEGK